MLIATRSFGSTVELLVLREDMGFCSVKPDILGNHSRCSDDMDNPTHDLERPQWSRLSSASNISEETASGWIAKATGTGRTTPERREPAGMDDDVGNEDGFAHEDWPGDEAWLETTFALLDGVDTA